MQNSQHTPPLAQSVLQIVGYAKRAPGGRPSLFLLVLPRTQTCRSIRPPACDQLLPRSLPPDVSGVDVGPVSEEQVDSVSEASAVPHDLTVPVKSHTIAGGERGSRRTVIASLK